MNMRVPVALDVVGQTIHPRPCLYPFTPLPLVPYRKVPVRRDLRHLANTPFDLLIVGAGIYGAAAAWDATERGWSVALIDRDDFGGGTSFNSAKTIHGGVRSLQRGRLGEVREYLRERRTLCRILPHLVHRLPFLIPTYRTLPRHRWLLAAYFAVNDLVAFDRNALPDPSKHLPRSHLISRAECLARHPVIDPTDVTGAMIWHDCQLYNSDRATLTFVRSAAERGAAAANYVEARSLMVDRGRVCGVRAYDRLAGEGFEVRARMVLVAAGPWSETLVRTASTSRRPLVAALSRAMNVVVRPIAEDCAVGGSARGRLFFLAPWRHVTIAGTSHDPYDAPPETLVARRGDVTSLLDDLNAAFPGARLTLDDVRLVHRGLLPAQRDRNVVLLRRSLIRDHHADGLDGLISMVGVRYTTARHTAEHAVTRAFARAGRRAPASRSASTPLDGGDIPDVNAFLARGLRDRPTGITESTMRRLLLSYGTRYPELLTMMRRHPELARPLARTCDIRRAEIVYAVREEMAMRLADAVLRRTEAGSAGHPGSDALSAAADIMAQLHGWRDAVRQDEIANVERLYQVEE
ncbi:MAG: FAD-dependent oxidoreductase [Luteitalea sp.]|nr:FAD-dependent oxidoreductase [Luteitalea sp.]